MKIIKKIVEGTYDNQWWRVENPELWKKAVKLAKLEMRKPMRMENSKVEDFLKKNSPSAMALSSLRYSLVQDILNQAEAELG